MAVPAHATELLIDGEQVDGAGERLAVENPFTTATIVELGAASPEQVDAAVTAAREAWRGWSRMTAGERCELLHEIARRLRDDAEARAQTMTAEGGKPLIENRDELEWTAAAFDYYAEIGREACTPWMARMNLEMGGKDAFIVCADVAPQLEVAARGGAWAAFLNAGQVCTSAERFYVAREVYDDYVEAFVDHTRSLVLGDPFELATDVGPMVSAPQRQKVVAQLEAASAAGAEVLVGGDRGGQERGHFLSPAVVVDADPDSALLREETFGPVAPIVPVASLDEAIELANGTEFGLGANVYTADLENAVRCMRELRAGTVWINDPLTDNDAGPFGGFKQSGLGRELGREGLEAFQETKHVHMESRIERKEWWYPYKEYGAS
jgi:acyl-CoA reductase-like NAD-dependent aldehyde dehydrogenase